MKNEGDLVRSIFSNPRIYSKQRTVIYFTIKTVERYSMRRGSILARNIGTETVYKKTAPPCPHARRVTISSNYSR